MIVAGFDPALNCAIAWTISSRGRPARPATADPAAGRPLVPWHIEHAAAIDCTPLGERSGAAKFGAGGAGCWASDRALPRPASPRRIFLIGFTLGLLGPMRIAPTKTPAEAGVFAS